MPKGLEQTLLQGRHTEGPETYEKMLSLTSHQREASYNHDEIPPHTDQDGHPLTNQQTSAGEDVKKRELQSTLGGNGDWCCHCGKQYGISSKN